MGRDMYLLLDGVLSVEVDGTPVAQVGPGAVVGERALLEGGRRTATLRALTPSKVAAASGDDLSPETLSELAAGHRREAGSAWLIAARTRSMATSGRSVANSTRRPLSSQSISSRSSSMPRSRGRRAGAPSMT